MNRTQRVLKLRPGVALLIVLMIGLLALVAVTGLLGYVSFRQRAVSGEAISDRSLALADGFIDQLLTNINAQGELTKSAQGSPTAGDAVVKSLLANLNGGNADTDTLDVIRKNVRSYVFDTSTSTYYRLADGAVYTKGIVTSGTLKSLDGATTYGAIDSSSAPGDPSFATDNRWYQIDTNCDYRYAVDKPDIWGLRVTAFNISTPELRRTVQADAGRGEVSVEPNWYRWVVGHNGLKSFCEYAGVYNNGVSYGPYEVISGPIRSNGSVNMAGWAQAEIYASGQVTDGGGSGRFGPGIWKRDNADIGQYVFTGYPPAVWANGVAVLTGSDPLRSGTDTGIQDKCDANYYVNGDATVVFSNPDGVADGVVGMVTINDVPLAMPPDGLIFVEGNAWVGGTVDGRVTLGCNGTINIQDNIVYAIPPRVNSAYTMPLHPDALGLIAGQQVFIPKATYDTHHTLEIDAAFFSATGGLQIDPAVATHNDSNTSHYEAFWNGSQSMNDASKAPLVGSGSVQGYELQHTNFDWNLKDYGAPPMYPTTGTEAISTESTYVLLKLPDDSAVLSQLNGVTLVALDPSSPAYNASFAKFYFQTDATHTYYTSGSSGTMYAKYSPDQTTLSRYRVSWKEQIATPVRQPQP